VRSLALQLSCHILVYSECPEIARSEMAETKDKMGDTERWEVPREGCVGSNPTSLNIKREVVPC
jgi:hypothetical protein